MKPAAAFYHPQLHEYLLMYDDVRRADSPKDFADAVSADYL